MLVFNSSSAALYSPCNFSIAVVKSVLLAFSEINVFNLVSASSRFACTRSIPACNSVSAFLYALSNAEISLPMLVFNNSSAALYSESNFSIAAVKSVLLAFAEIKFFNLVSASSRFACTRSIPACNSVSAFAYAVFKSVMSFVRPSSTPCNSDFNNSSASL